MSGESNEKVSLKHLLMPPGIGVSRHFLNFTGIKTSPASDISPGDYSFNVVDATAFAENNEIFISENNVMEVNKVVIRGIISNTIRVNQPLDMAYTSAATIEKVNSNMAVSATQISPVSFIAKPPSDKICFLNRMMVVIKDSRDTSDIGKFGGNEPLPNGMLFRQSASGVKKTITCWRSNADMALDYFDVDPAPRVGGGIYGIKGRYSFYKNDLIHVLNGAKNDYLEFLVQDNMTGHIGLEIKIHGYIRG